MLLGSDLKRFRIKEMEKIEMVSPTPVVAVTKCGIGIFDMEWWRPRIALFRAVTLPSILSAAEGREFNWFLLLDEDMPIEALSLLRTAIAECGGGRYVRLHFVRSSVDANKSGINCIRSVAGDHTRVMVMRVDDDDAVSRDAFSIADTAIEDRNRAAVVSLVDGYAFNAPEGKIGELTYQAHTSNTYFYGTAREVAKVLWNNHTKALGNAEKLGYQTAVVSGEGRNFLFTFHKQGDGSYEKRIDSIAEWRPVSAETEKDFGINTADLGHWMELQSAAEPTLGLTWRRTMPEINEIRSLDTQIARIKKQVVRTNSRLFDRSVPFVYLLRPAIPPAKVKQGNVVFDGVATPGATVVVKVAGKKAVFNEVARTVADGETGQFKVKRAFKRSNWRIRIELILPETDAVAKRWNFGLEVV